ncbi:hypothetical protein WICPIJ_003645 [Wickerhamomyces pijperi]|uniref:Large ribosomal subunit protein uL29m n=1 Tax=Wickerhamomyces pijperi TaxID=599730 RepID=A0A9P8Q9E6_WICPI|nr:hypothetical protein WICPIJ_003645 [Wickerhamomyces pijperi]
MFKRSLHTTTKTLARKQQVNLTIKPPIAPTAKNLKVSDDHPLWQFFHNKKFLRKYDELDTVGRPWSIPELRRKNFNDLHSIWYACLRERNSLAREVQVLSAEAIQPDRNFMEQSDKIRETMWRIRHVLSERYHQQENARVEESQIEEFQTEFQQYYLEAGKEEESDIQESLKRFQYAIFGISEYISENTVDKKFISGLKYIANLKLQRYAPTSDLGVVTDVGEAFILFHAESTEKDIQEQIETIKGFRSQGISVARDEEIDHIKAYLAQLQ